MKPIPELETLKQAVKRDVSETDHPAVEAAFAILGAAMTDLGRIADALEAMSPLKVGSANNPSLFSPDQLNVSR